MPDGSPASGRAIQLPAFAAKACREQRPTLRVSQPKASRHLAYLRRAGLVETRKEGLWVHYRLADVADPVMAAVKQAVTHALGHLPDVQRNAQRLQRKNGCCLPVAAASSTFACCSEPADARSR